MKNDNINIFPSTEESFSRVQKQKVLNQSAKVIWLTGLSGSGKTTIAKILEKKLVEKGFFTQLLDGDNLRSGINKNLGFTEMDRDESNRRVAEISKLFLNCGIITINCLISPTEEIRNNARELIGKNDFIEVFIDTPIEICESRDPKGLYIKARKGEIKNFTGIDSPYEKPRHPNFTITTTNQSAEEAANKLVKFILPHIIFHERL